MNNEYAKLLRKKEWKEKRTFILDLNGGKCARCGRTTNLHVHHKYYNYGKLPWNYPNDAYEVLCANCHKKEHNIGETTKKTTNDFVQVYLEDMIGLMKITSRNELRVLVWLWKCSAYITGNQIGNMIVANHILFKQITKSTGIRTQSIRNIISALKKKNLIIADKNGRGVYYLNPVYFFKGALSDRAKCYSKIIQYQIEE